MSQVARQSFRAIFLKCLPCSAVSTARSNEYAEKEYLKKHGNGTYDQIVPNTEPTDTMRRPPKYRKAQCRIAGWNPPPSPSTSSPLLGTTGRRGFFLHQSTDVISPPCRRRAAVEVKQSMVCHHRSGRTRWRSSVHHLQRVSDTTRSEKNCWGQQLTWVRLVSYVSGFQYGYLPVNTE